VDVEILEARGRKTHVMKGPLLLPDLVQDVVEDSVARLDEEPQSFDPVALLGRHLDRLPPEHTRDRIERRAE
jgi:hypothetical protein